MKSFAILLFATLAAAAAGFGAASAATVTVPPVANPYGQSIDVRVVNVEGVVTDRRGARVRGLKAADFRLLVDGREVSIDYFTEIASGQAVTAAPAQAAKAPAATAAPAASAPPGTIAAPGEAVGINYLVYVDDQFAIRARRNLVLQKLAADLGRLGPHDQMMLLTFDGRKVARLNEWTGDRKTLEAVYALAEERPAFGLQAIAESRSDGNESQMVEESGPAYVSQGMGIETGMRAVMAAMRGTPTPPGRKVMLFLNAGWGLQVPPQSDTGAPSAFSQPEAAKVFAPVFETANLLGYTLYTVEIPGPLAMANHNDVTIMALSSHDAAMANIGRNQVISNGIATAPDMITSEFGRSLHENLEVIANQTGGKAILNSAWQNAFERVAADTSAYYWLGFTPQWKADGSRHRIELEVRRPGLAVRSRSGFSDLSRKTEAQTQAESALLFGPPALKHPLAVTTGALRRVSFLQRELPVTVQVPADALAPQVEEGTWSLVGTLSIAILDKSGGDARWQTVPVRFKSNGLPPAGATTSVQTLLKLPRSTRQVVFAVGGEHGEVRAWGTLDLQSLK